MGTLSSGCLHSQQGSREPPNESIIKLLIVICTIKELNWVQGQKETRKTHFRWNVQVKVSLTFKVTFKHLRLEAWEGANSAKARGRAFQTERRASPQVPSGGVRSKGQQAWIKVGRRQEPGPAVVVVRHAHGILRQWEDFEEFLSKKMPQYDLCFKSSLRPRCEKWIEQDKSARLLC